MNEFEINEVMDLIEESNLLRQQIIEQEFKLQQALNYNIQKDNNNNTNNYLHHNRKLELSSTRRDKINENIKQIQKNNDDLNKATLALANSTQRTLIDLYYIEETQLIYIVFEEDNQEIEMEYNFNTNQITAIKSHQLNHKDTIHLDTKQKQNIVNTGQHFNKVLTLLSQTEQPFCKQLINFLQEINLQ